MPADSNAVAEKTTSPADRSQSSNGEAATVASPRPTATRPVAMTPADLAPLMPPHLGLTERAVADFRAFLSANGCGDWPVFHAADDEVYDIDRYLPKLDAEAGWSPPPSLTGLLEAGAALRVKADDADAGRAGEFDLPGFLLMRDLGVAIARWYWVDPEYSTADSLWLLAARDAESYDELRGRIKALRHRGGRATWQTVRGHPGHDGPRLRRRKNAGDELVLSDDIKQRLDRDLVGFFRPEVKKLYKKLDVPYRRGVLLHGPPGNGKTSLIRMVGAKLPRVPFLVMRPDRRIDAGSLRQVIDRWQKQAPSVLVIEDLNWLLEVVDVSQFLNLVDGIERPSAKGLLLIATTNYPERLDPAVNNRPGRFDVVVELPNPDTGLRRRFIDRELGDLAEDVRGKVAAESEGLSFAHLREILRLSGLLAIDEGRGEREGGDVLKAVNLVREGNDRAVRGFPKPPEIPFGIQHARRGG